MSSTSADVDQSSSLENHPAQRLPSVQSTYSAVSVNLLNVSLLGMQSSPSSDPTQNVGKPTCDILLESFLCMQLTPLLVTDADSTLDNTTHGTLRTCRQESGGTAAATLPSVGAIP